MTLAQEIRENPATDYMNAEGVCEMVPGLTSTMLAQHRFKGTGPKYMKPNSRVVLYSRADVVEWLESTKRSGTSEAA